MAAAERADAEPAAFFAATVEHARRVLEAEEGWPTYHAGIAFQGLAMSLAASHDAPALFPNEEPMALYLIWGGSRTQWTRPAGVQLSRMTMPCET